jgi:hypothetical protein
VSEQADAYKSAAEMTAISSAGKPNGQTNETEPQEADVERKDHVTIVLGKGGKRRPAHYGLDIQFEDRPSDREMGRLVESTVWVNRAHPAYHRALVSRSVGYHIALTVAMALAPLAVEAANEHGFVTAFLSRWGEALNQRGTRKRKT